MCVMKPIMVLKVTCAHLNPQLIDLLNVYKLWVNVIIPMMHSMMGKTGVTQEIRIKSYWLYKKYIQMNLLLD